MRILIVEDDFPNRLLLQKILAPYGECNTVIDGHEGVAAFGMAWEDGHPYDLIIMDLLMPEMNGQEAIQEIRKKEKELHVDAHDGVKIIILTAVVDTKSVMSAFMEGCEAYLTKPVKPEKLAEQIQKLGLVK